MILPIGKKTMWSMLEFRFSRKCVTKQRKCGIGAKLVERLIAFSKEQHLSFLSLEVRKSNSAAIRLYDKLGFVKVGERKKFLHKASGGCGDHDVLFWERVDFI